MSIYLSKENPHVRLKSYDATIKGQKTTLRITVEVTDPYELSFLLKSLEELQTAPRKQRQTADPERRPLTERQTAISRVPMLALPAPKFDAEDA
jgi:hypothetical protein